MLIIGKCHCGNIAFTLDWPADQPDVPARACNCSFRFKHGGVWTSNPRAKLSVVLQHTHLVSKYVFGTVSRSAPSTRKPQPGRNVRLRQLQADMKPFKFFSLPSLGLKLYWGK